MTKSIFLIGAGAVGGSLARALFHADRRICGVCDLNPARSLAVATATGAVDYGDSLPTEITEADIVLVAVPDRAILSVSKSVSTQGRFSARQIWLHVAGGLSSAALAPLKGKVKGLGVLHPALVFPPDELTDISSGTFFSVEGEDAAVDAAKDIAQTLSGHTVLVSAQARPLYHAATVMASNYLAALLAEAGQILELAGIKDGDAEQLIASLATSALDRIVRIGVKKSLSGPIRRGDSETVERHIRALGHYPELRELYRLLGLSTARLTEAIGDTASDDLKSVYKFLER